MNHPISDKLARIYKNFFRILKSLSHRVFAHKNLFNTKKPINVFKTSCIVLNNLEQLYFHRKIGALIKLQKHFAASFVGSLLSLISK